MKTRGLCHKTRVQLGRIHAMLQHGRTIAAIARATGLSRPTIYALIRKHGRFDKQLRV